jgi:hypothetical protein
MKHSQVRIKTMIHGVIRGKNRGLPSRSFQLEEQNKKKASLARGATKGVVLDGERLKRFMTPLKNI